MIIHFINPFQYGDKKQWDMCFIKDGEQMLRQTVTFDVSAEDTEIETFGGDYFYAQDYKDENNEAVFFSEIIIDKPTEWQS